MRRLPSSFFTIDVVASIPSETIALIFSDSPLKFLRILKALRMAKLFRLVRLLRLDPLKDVEGGTINPGVLRLCKLVVSALVNL